MGELMVIMAQNSEIVFKKVTKTAQSKKMHTVILEDCSFTVDDGKLTVLIGPSGCGKTTVINLVAGYDKPDRGEILINGIPVGPPSWERLVVFQETALFPWLTCYENVIFGPTANGLISKKQAHEETVAILDKVGLRDFRDKYPIQLSGGMQRRVELARALINKPKVMLMDEPFRGLDAMTRKIMQEYYLRLFEEKPITNVFVTSELEEAIILADNLLVMTNKPARIKKTVKVNLPHPRDWSMTSSKQYREIKAEILELLHEEAIRASMESGKVDLDLTELSKGAMVQK